MLLAGRSTDRRQVVEQRLAHPDASALADARGRHDTRRPEHDDRRTVLKIAHLVATAEPRAAGDTIGPRVAQVERNVEKGEADARDQDRADRPPSSSTSPELRRAFAGTTARSFLQNSRATRLERDRIDVPGIAGDVVDLGHVTVLRRVESVIHARGQAKRDVGAVTVTLRERGDRRPDRQVCSRNPSPGSARAGDAPAGADDGVARADEHAQASHRPAARRPSVRG